MLSHRYTDLTGGRCSNILGQQTMPEASDGTRPAGQNADQGVSNASPNDRRNNRNRNKRAPREGKFVGKCADIEGFVYDVVSSKDTFQKTTREIAEYVGRTYEDAAEFRTGMVDLDLPANTAPTRPADPNDAFEMKIWELKQREFMAKERSRARNSGRIVALLLGQCSQALRNRMEGDTDWERINAASDVIGLLQLIQQNMSQQRTRKYPIHTLIDAESRLLTFKQGQYRWA